VTVTGRPSFLLVLLCATAATGLGPKLARATTARVVALRGQFAFADETDVFRFPSAAPQYGDRVGLDFTPSASEGNGGALWGRTLTLGLYLNRPPLFDDIGEIGAIHAGVETPEMHRLFDAVLAWQIEEHHAIGALLGTSFGLQSVDADVPFDNRGRLSDGSRALAVDLGLGHSYAGPALVNDVSLALTFRSFEQQDAGETFAEGSGPPSLAVRDRLVLGPGAARAFGVELLLARRSYGIHQPGTDIDGTYVRTLAQVDAGPRWAFGGRVTLATAVRLRYEKLAGEVDDQSGPNTFALGFPGAVAGLEARVYDRWRLRAGADYLFQYVQTEDGEQATGDPTQIRSAESVFSWSVGLGFADGGFSVDAMLASNLVLDGPNFVGGTSPGLFATLSGVYRWE
jgi:hypothetical protein